ncbi:MAG: hypothetical protein KF764_24045 [Labilithrix sp.]|nr:hypothetical protein [Labilithrix sp.]MBX3219890.1 hypothetical protein [Labilithrix sp.]
MAAARRRSGELEREESLEERIEREAREAAEATDRGSGPDLLDVPAAVVCAFCGDADCSGCRDDLEDLSRSGIVSVVAWERAGVPVFSRLWSTARSTTRDAEGFFELLPDGPLMPALRFAVLSELLASGAAFASFVAVAAVIAPEWLGHLARDPAARSVTLRVVLFGLPAFAALLVAAHAAHGLSIDVGATRQGARGARSRALRFGLYACGWDLVMGPLGAIVVAVKEGMQAALGLAGALSGLPTRATNAFVRGCYRLEGERSRAALAISYVGASVATLVFAVAILVAIAALVLI